MEPNQAPNPDHHAETSAAPWERELIEKLAMASLKEQKTARRWGIFFKLLGFAYLTAILSASLYPDLKQGIGATEKEHTAVIDIEGAIGEHEGGVSAKHIIEGLQNALKDKNTVGVILNLNSPGGSPVQSATVYDEIRRQKQLHPNIPIYSVVGDLCASGGYYIAAASDKIYVSPASLIGSIGVIMNGFGFNNTLDKLGIERRLLTAGEHKALLDPFSPLKIDEQKHMQTLLDQVHRQFIDAVRAGRGGRIQDSDAGQVYSGLIWTGEQSIKIGLADDFGSVESVARDILGAETLVDYTPQEHLLERLTGKLGASFGHALGATLNFSGLR